jgi:hypothetical protein
MPSRCRSRIITTFPSMTKPVSLDSSRQCWPVAEQPAPRRSETVSPAKQRNFQPPHPKKIHPAVAQNSAIWRRALTQTSRDTCSTNELSGGNSRATIRSLCAGRIEQPPDVRAPKGSDPIRATTSLTQRTGARLVLRPESLHRPQTADAPVLGDACSAARLIGNPVLNGLLPMNLSDCDTLVDLLSPHDRA